MDTLGDFEESSRAVPTDVDIDDSHIRLVSEVTEDGKTLKMSTQPGTLTVCCFNGSTSQSLAESYLNCLGDKAVLISKAFLVHDRNDCEDDGLSNNKLSKRLVLSVFKVNNIVLVVTDQEQFGSVFGHELLDSEVGVWVELAKMVYIFHADSNSNFKSSLSSGELYCLKSSSVGDKELNELKMKGIKPLPMPNLIEHFSAALLIHCEMVNKPCLLVVKYTEFSDTLSHVPFLRFIQSTPSLRDLPKLSSDIALRTKTNNSILYNSNLFI
jgi:hypothetical protein